MRKLIQFGKDHLVKDEVFGQASHGYRKGNIITYPAIMCNHNKVVEVEINPLKMLIPFSYGSEASDWIDHNCSGCAKEQQCALLQRLLSAYANDGKIPFKTAARIGYTAIYIQANNCDFVSLTNCKEREVPNG